MFLLHTPSTGLFVHAVDTSIINAQLRKAQEAMYRGMKGPMSDFVNQLALNWVVEGLEKLPGRVAERTNV